MKPTLYSKTDLKRIQIYKENSHPVEKKPEEYLFKSYNSDFYETLKASELPPIGQNRLFYNFEQNLNASVSTTTGQIGVSFTKFIIINSYRSKKPDRLIWTTRSTTTP